MPRIMGLDLGNKTIGVALSDALGITAQGHSVIRRTELAADLLRLREIIEANEVERIVLGLPKNMDNSIGEQGQASLEFAAVLREQIGLEVVLVDERLSTKAAERVLREQGRRGQKQRQLVDIVAATWILEGYLRGPRKTHIETLLKA